MDKRKLDETENEELETNKQVVEDDYSEINYLPIGITLGMLLGIVIGKVALNNVGIGISLGISVGTVFGVAFQNKKH